MNTEKVEQYNPSIKYAIHSTQEADSVADLKNLLDNLIAY